MIARVCRLFSAISARGCREIGEADRRKIGRTNAMKLFKLKDA